MGFAPQQPQQPPMQFIMQQLYTQQQQSQLMMQQFMANSNPTVKKPTTAFPKYSGSLDTFPFFVMRLNLYKADPYFASVTNWSVTLPTSVSQSKRIHDDMFEILPSKYLHQFLDQTMFEGRGIEMLVALLESIHPNNPTQRLLDI